MRRFILPVVSVVIGIVTSRGLQYAGVAPLLAKSIAIGVVIVFIALVWRKRAAV
jgi:hypothetical protein